MTCFSLFLSIVFLDALLDPPGYLGKLQGESTATSYLEHVINGEEERAFDYVYYFDGFIDEEVNISHEKAKQIWVDLSNKGYRGVRDAIVEERRIVLL